MGFQPFGYRFEVCSTFSPAEVKSIIRWKKKSMFDANNGARGWIVGPVICLWFSAFDRYGPMLFGIISQHNLGTRIRGRAGSDLNGVLAFTLWVPLMGFLVFQMLSQGSASLELLLVIGLVFLVGGPLIYWSAHKERRGAEPLVRFLKNVIKPTSSAAMGSEPEMPNGLTLIVNGELSSTLLSPDAIQDALLRTGNGDVVILESGPEDYVQTIGSDGGYILEMRQGSSSRHFKGTRRTAPQDSRESGTLTFKEAVAVFTAYACGAQMPDFLRWEPFNLPQ